MSSVLGLWSTSYKYPQTTSSTQVDVPWATAVCIIYSYRTPAEKAAKTDLDDECIVALGFKINSRALSMCVALVLACNERLIKCSCSMRMRFEFSDFSTRHSRCPWAITYIRSDQISARWCESQASSRSEVNQQSTQTPIYILPGTTAVVMTT